MSRHEGTVWTRILSKKSGEQFAVSDVLQEFDSLRRQIGLERHGEPGAFVGYSDLEHRQLLQMQAGPHAIAQLEIVARLISSEPRRDVIGYAAVARTVHSFRQQVVGASGLTIYPRSNRTLRPE